MFVTQLSHTKLTLYHGKLTKLCEPQVFSILLNGKLELGVLMTISSKSGGSLIEISGFSLSKSNLDSTGLWKSVIAQT